MIGIYYFKSGEDLKEELNYLLDHKEMKEENTIAGCFKTANRKGTSLCLKGFGLVRLRKQKCDSRYQ